MKSNINYLSESNKQNLRKDTTNPMIIDLQNAKVIEILTLDKDINNFENTTKERLEQCKSWSLTKDQIKNIIRKFLPISSEEENLVYSFWPCDLVGEMKIDTLKFKYYLSPGSTLWLEYGDTTFIFACKSKKCKKLFLSGKDDITEEKKYLKNK